VLKREYPNRLPKNYPEEQEYTTLSPSSPLPPHPISLILPPHSAFGGISVGLLYFAFWIFLMFPNWFIPVGRPGIALGGGMLMIVYRFVLYSTDQGPWFQAENVIIKEPLYLLFGLMLTTVYLEKMETGGLFDKLRNSLDDPINWKRSFKIMMMVSGWNSDEGSEPGEHVFVPVMEIYPKSK